MGLMAQLVAAEAVRAGASIWLEDPALAPFAAGLAGRRAQLAEDGWDLGEVSEGFRYAVPRLSERSDGQPGTVALAATLGTGIPAGVLPDLWLRPGQPPEGFEPLGEGVADIWHRLASTHPMRQRLEALAAGLASGETDIWDWMAANLVGRTCLREIGWSAPGFAALSMDPRFALQMGSAEIAHQTALCSNMGIHGTRDLRVPVFSLPSTAVRLTFSGSGIYVSLPGHADAPLTSVEGGRTVATVSTAPLAPWVDLRLHGRGIALERVEVVVPDPMASPDANVMALDPLETYGDPLGTYLPVDAP